MQLKDRHQLQTMNINDGTQGEKQLQYVSMQLKSNKVWETVTSNELLMQ